MPVQFIARFREIEIRSRMTEFAETTVQGECKVFSGGDRSRCHHPSAKLHDEGKFGLKNHRSLSPDIWVNATFSKAFHRFMENSACLFTIVSIRPIEAALIRRG